MANRLLWADDEIELLIAHIIFLRNKGYEVDTVTNGLDAIEACKTTSFDLILLDENMPGLTGLETLSAIKEMSGWTIYACVILAGLMLVVPWPKRDISKDK